MWGITFSKRYQNRVRVLQFFLHLWFLNIFSLGLGLWDLCFTYFKSSSMLRQSLLEQSCLLKWSSLEDKSNHIYNKTTTFFFLGLLFFHCNKQWWALVLIVIFFFFVSVHQNKTLTSNVSRCLFLCLFNLRSM
jgi:hypothetical protein